MSGISEDRDNGRSLLRTMVRALHALVLSAALGGCGDDNDRPKATPTATVVPTATATAVVNQAPVLAPIGAPTVVVVNHSLLIQLSATDPEGQPLVYSASPLPPESYFLPDSALFSFSPTMRGEYEITFRVSDGELSDEETISLEAVFLPNGGGGVVMDPLGNHDVRAGETLELHVSATTTSASPLTYKMYPEPDLAPLVTLDANTGRFTFSPTAAQIGEEFDITFQACVLDGADCSPTVQAHQTIHLAVEPALTASCGACPDYVPTTCADLPAAVPPIVDKCYKVTKAGTYTGGNVNIISKASTKGAIYVVEDAGKTIDIRVNSLLVEKGGTLQAGSPCCPFGKQNGTLSIGLYGDDPSMQATTPSPTPGIECQTAPKSTINRCFPSNRDFKPDTFYCTQSGTDDPCISKTPPPTPVPTGTPVKLPPTSNNYLLEEYRSLNFDPTSFGYKVLGVSYGGALNLFGYKGALPLHGADGAKIGAGEDDHCVVPTVSTLDTAEMKEWAKLSGSSWGRLDDLNGPRTELTLDRSVKDDWQPGDQIVVGTTDWQPSHSELRTIRKIEEVGGVSKITVCVPTVPAGTGPGGCAAAASTADALEYPHYTKIFDAKTLGAQYTLPANQQLNRSAVDLRATVGLLSRSIQIRSLGADATTEFPSVDKCLIKTDGSKQDPSCYFGGHVMVRQGFKEVQIQGVEFRQLGQGGRMGHYPMHFHLAKNTDYTGKKAFVKDSSVWDSMTRFAVIHGTHGVTLSRNVGFASVGNGYYLEDASEVDNRLCHNLGVSARGALKEFYEAQAKNPKGPTLMARWVPPILDGVCGGPSSTDCNCQTPKGPSDPPTICAANDPVRVPVLRLGSDAFMPVMFWAMNAYNEFVGNAAVGVHGFGSCYWLLPGGLSGPSAPTSQHPHKFGGLASFNTIAHQAPLLRFRGNTCMSAALALSAQARIDPATYTPGSENPYSAVGYTAVDNPYLFDKDGKKKPPAVLDLDFARPAVEGNFQPIAPNTAGSGGSVYDTCGSTAAVGTVGTTLANNPKSCAITTIDRFSTSYNWAQINFAAVWLRPWFYLFSNAALTDQLFGGLTFVTGGSWFQLPPAYFSLAQNGLYIGTSQTDETTNTYAKRSGPIFPVAASTVLTKYPPCSRGDQKTCNLDIDGTGYWRGGAYNPKRLISIYDGPQFADGNLFLNVGAWTCEPQPCQGKSMGQCVQSQGLPCGIYSSTRQPAVVKDGVVDRKQMLVLDAAVGWKQNNGFYYPPSFAYRNSIFFKQAPAAMKSLNQCVDAKGVISDGACRHNVVDRTRKYIEGNMLDLTGPTKVLPDEGSLEIGPIDFQTFIADLDATLTGVSGVIPLPPADGQCTTCSGSCTTADGHKGTCGRRDTSSPCRCEVTLPTTSLSRNAFFDAPGQGDECRSFGLQTSPYQFVTSVMAELREPTEPGKETYATIADADWPDRPGVAIYRQWKLAHEDTMAGQVCDGGVSSVERSTFMVGPNVWHAPSLTQSFPPGLGPQPGQLYYIDTSGGPLTSFTGSVTFTAPHTIAATGIGTRLTAGDSISVQAAMQGANNRKFTVATASPNSITVNENVVSEGPTANVRVTSNPLQQITCYPGTVGFSAARFSKNKTYLLYHLYARNDAKISYQFYVGEGVKSVADVNGNFVRVDIRQHQGVDFAALVHDVCKPGDASKWCGAMPTPQVDGDGILTVTLDQSSIASDFVVENREDHDRCMPRDLCFYDKDSKRCEACATTTDTKRTANCIRQSDFLKVDLESMSTKDGTGKNPLDVVCQDWATYASGTAKNQVGELSLIDCPKGGCLGFAFTLPDSFVGNKKYNDKGAAASRCFKRSEWQNDALVQPTNSNDPVCGTPAPTSNFCDDPGPAGTPTATATATHMGPTPTRTNTPMGGAPTPTNAGTRAATATVTRTGLVTRTVTATGTTPTVTPTPSMTPTVTATPGGSGLSWRLNGTPTANITVPQAGMTYQMGMLTLVDGQNRFCTAGSPYKRVNYRSA
jgi:cell surface hyaluronidase